MLKLRINPIVAKDLKNIRDYIAEDSEEYAAKTIKEIYGKFENLQMFPGMGSDLSKRVSFLYKVIFANIKIFMPVLDRICKKGGGEMIDASLPVEYERFDRMQAVIDGRRESLARPLKTGARAAGPGPFSGRAPLCL